MKFFIWFVVPAVYAQPSWNAQLSTAPPCGNSTWVGGTANLTNVPSTVNSTYNEFISEDSNLPGIYAAYDCLCGNMNTQFIGDCKMGNTCMPNGGCISACQYDMLEPKECACARGDSTDPNVADTVLASATLIVCTGGQTCIGPFNKNPLVVGKQGTCVDKCNNDTPVSGDEICSCSKHDSVEYCQGQLNSCIEGTCLEPCPAGVWNSNTKCACGVTACSDTETCDDGKCIAPCSIGTLITGPCLCTQAQCGEGDVCNNSHCMQKCTDSVVSNCWCTESYQGCVANSSCHNGACVANCDAQASALAPFYTNSQCACGTTVCTKDFPWCTFNNTTCTPDCVEGMAGTYCRCNSNAFCDSSKACDGQGSCVQPTQSPTQSPTLGQGATSSGEDSEHEVANGVGKENLFLVCMISLLISSV